MPHLISRVVLSKSARQHRLLSTFVCNHKIIVAPSPISINILQRIFVRHPFPFN